MLNLKDSLLRTQEIREAIVNSSHGARRMKLKTLLAKFACEKRSDSNTAQITQFLTDAGLALNPPIVRFGEEWDIGPEDWIYLTDSYAKESTPSVLAETPEIKNWSADPWFDRIASISLRTEKEVEIKFIVPLLFKLGFDDDDRYDGMPVPAAHGSRDTTLVIDFALFNSSVQLLAHQPLLTVEAKKEDRLKKREELMRAHNQAKSYCLWTQCDFFLITDSKTLQAFHIARGKIGDLNPLFTCERHELKERFGDLYKLISKEILTKRYLDKLQTKDEAF
jgi:hypothetical protein